MTDYTFTRESVIQNAKVLQDHQESTLGESAIEAISGIAAITTNTDLSGSNDSTEATADAAVDSTTDSTPIATDFGASTPNATNSVLDPFLVPIVPSTFINFDANPSTLEMDIAFIDSQCFILQNDKTKPFNGQDIQPFQIGNTTVSNNDEFNQLIAKNKDEECDQWVYYQFCNKAISNSSKCPGKPLCKADCEKMNEKLKNCGFPTEQCPETTECIFLDNEGSQFMLEWWAILLIVLALLIPCLLCLFGLCKNKRKSEMQSMSSKNSWDSRRSSHAYAYGNSANTPYIKAPPAVIAPSTRHPRNKVSTSSVGSASPMYPTNEFNHDEYDIKDANELSPPPPIMISSKTSLEDIPTETPIESNSTSLHGHVEPIIYAKPATRTPFVASTNTSFTDIPIALPQAKSMTQKDLPKQDLPLPEVKSKRPTITSMFPSLFKSNKAEKNDIEQGRAQLESIKPDQSVQPSKLPNTTQPFMEQAYPPSPTTPTLSQKEQLRQDSGIIPIPIIIKKSSEIDHNDLAISKDTTSKIPKLVKKESAQLLKPSVVKQRSNLASRPSTLKETPMYAPVPSNLKKTDEGHAYSAKGNEDTIKVEKNLKDAKGFGMDTPIHAPVPSILKKTEDKSLKNNEGTIKEEKNLKDTKGFGMDTPIHAPVPSIVKKSEEHKSNENTPPDKAIEAVPSEYHVDIKDKKGFGMDTPLHAPTPSIITQKMDKQEPTLTTPDIIQVDEAEQTGSRRMSFVSHTGVKTTTTTKTTRKTTPSVITTPTSRLTYSASFSDDLCTPTQATAPVSPIKTVKHVEYKEKLTLAVMGVLIKQMTIRELINGRYEIIHQGSSTCDIDYYFDRNQVIQIELKNEKTTFKHTIKLAQLIMEVQQWEWDMQLVHCSVTVHNKNGVLAYLQHGLKLKFSVGIDFTSSNKPPQNTDSLHYIGSKDIPSSKLTPYEKSMKVVGEIVSAYGGDEISAYGFGAQVKVGSKFQTSHDFLLQSKPIHTVDELLTAYRKTLRKIKLGRPTNFTPHLKTIGQVARRSKQDYYVHLIITDGQVTDYSETVDELINCSNYPMNVIILGVGNENFDKMELLNSEHGPLISTKTQRAAKRDACDFYEMRQNIESKLIVSGIPYKILSYAHMKNLVPKDFESPISP